MDGEAQWVLFLCLPPNFPDSIQGQRTGALKPRSVWRPGLPSMLIESTLEPWEKNVITGRGLEGEGSSLQLVARTGLETD